MEYFERMEVTDFRNDIILAEACRADVDKHCAKVKPGASPSVSGFWVGFRGFLRLWGTQ